MDDLFKGTSSRDKGTLFQLKNFFGHRNATGNVKESFSYVQDLIDFSTKGYVVLAALHFMNLNQLEEIPGTLQTTKAEKMELLIEVSKSILDLVYMSSQPIVRGIIRANIESTGDDYKFCSCKTERAGTQMIFCDNRKCSRGQWFHLECVNLTEDEVPDDAWFCSANCKKVKIGKVTKEKRKSVSIRLTDSKREYSRSLIWRGLNHMVRKDAIKEGDGERIILHWKFDLLEFYDKSHPKYFIFCHRLLSNINGAASDRLKHTLMWNRTVNPKGGRGNNIPMDLQMEFYNKEYKGKILILK